MSRVCECCALYYPLVQTCARCRAVRYCSRACQKMHWREEHSKKCSTYMWRALPTEIRHNVLSYVTNTVILTFKTAPRAYKTRLFDIRPSIRRAAIRLFGTRRLGLVGGEITPAKIRLVY